MSFMPNFTVSDYGINSPARTVTGIDTIMPKVTPRSSANSIDRYEDDAIRVIRIAHRVKLPRFLSGKTRFARFASFSSCFVSQGPYVCISNSLTSRDIKPMLKMLHIDIIEQSPISRNTFHIAFFSINIEYLVLYINYNKYDYRIQ